MYLALAGGSFAMTLVGLVVPGIPTVPFLLTTSYYLARSSRRLDERLRRTPLFGPILVEWERRHGLSRTSKLKLVGLTLTIVVVTVALTPISPVALVVIVLISSLSIVRDRPAARTARGGPRIRPDRSTDGPRSARALRRASDPEPPP